VITNGSIFIEQAHLTSGQQLLRSPRERPDAIVVRLDSVGHDPMAETPMLFLAAALQGLQELRDERAVAS
jgi:hypothetical protein